MLSKAVVAATLRLPMYRKAFDDITIFISLDTFLC